MTSYGTIPTSSSGGTNLEYLSRAKERIKAGLATRRPWKAMFDYRSFNFPAGISNAISRIRTNLAYFRMNYAIAVLLILFWSLLWYPISMIVFMVLLAAWVFLYFMRDEPLVIVHRTIDDRAVLAVLSVVTIGLLLLTGATINILASLLIGVALVVVHAALRKTDDLFLEEEAVETGGLLASSSS